MNCWFFVVLLLKYQIGAGGSLRGGVRSFLLLLPLLVLVLVLAVAASRIRRICCRTLAVHRAANRHYMMEMTLVKDMNLKVIITMTSVILMLILMVTLHSWNSYLCQELVSPALKMDLCNIIRHNHHCHQSSMAHNLSS